MYLSNSISLSDAISVYLDWKRTYTTTACDSYKLRLGDLVAYLGEGSILQEITPIHIANFINHLKQKPLKNGGIISLSTVSYSIDIIRNFFDFWRGRGVSNINPKEIKRIRHVKKYKEVVTKDDFEEMIETLDERYYSDLVKKLAIHLLWDTGMRVSELCDLKLADLGGQKENGLRSAMIRTRKTMRYNLAVWGLETNRLLNIYLGLRLDMEVSHDYLFCSHRGAKNPITRRTIERWVKDTADQAMIDKAISPHSFRHGKAHHMLDQGANQRDIVAVLRHANPVSTFHYLSLNENRFLEVAGKYL
jgi:integrase/recombinase XerD